MNNIKLFPMLILTLLVSSHLSADQKGVEAGRVLFEKWCAPCHGVGQVASLFLAHRYQDALPGALEKRTDLSRDLVLLRVRNQMPGMPAFRPTELADQEVEYLADYLTRRQ